MRSTRDFKCSNPVFEYLSGGMNYQIEHHLFPIMPRYKYPALQKVLQKVRKLLVLRPWLRVNLESATHVHAPALAFTQPAPHPIAFKFAAEHNIEYRLDGDWQVLRRTINNLASIAKKELDPNGPRSRPAGRTTGLKRLFSSG